MGEPEMAAAAAWAFGLDGRQTHKKKQGDGKLLFLLEFSEAATPTFFFVYPGPRNGGGRGTKKWWWLLFPEQPDTYKHMEGRSGKQSERKRKKNITGDFNACVVFSPQSFPKNRGGARQPIVIYGTVIWHSRGK